MPAQILVMNRTDPLMRRQPQPRRTVKRLISQSRFIHPPPPAPKVVFIKRDHPRPAEGLCTYVVSVSDEPGIYFGTFLGPDMICTVVNGLSAIPGVPTCKRPKAGLSPTPLHAAQRTEYLLS